MKKIVFLSILVIIGILFAVQIKRGLLSILILADSIRPPGKAVMGKLISGPLVKAVTIPVNGKTLRADLYTPKAKGSRFPLLLVHGVNPTGKDDDQLVLLAKDLARAGFLVLVPDFGGMKNLHMRFSDSDDIARSFLFLTKLKNARPRGGMLGISYGAGPMLFAAADQRIRDKVSVIATFGGYCDLRPVLLFLMTGSYDYGGRTGYLRPAESARWLFVYKNLDLIHSENDRNAIRAIIEKQCRFETADAAALARTLGPEGKSVYDFLVNTEQARFGALYDRLPPALREYVSRLSPCGAVRQSKAYFIIAHGMDDYAIPFTESLRLADAVGDESRVHLALLPQFMHIEPIDTSTENGYKRYFTGGWRLFWLIYDLLEKGEK